jgi:hypothetical protein
MLEKRKAAKALAQRDEEWRSLVRAITDPDGVVSESDQVRYLAYLGECDDANGSPPAYDPRRTQRERITGPRVERARQSEDRERERVDDLTGGGSWVGDADGREGGLGGQRATGH